jgi:glutamate transport system permease protein
MTGAGKGKSARHRPPVAHLLYDPPGPRSRRRTAAAGWGVVAVLAVLGFLFVVRPLAERGQLAAAKWSPIIDPSNDAFGPLWRRLGSGLWATLLAAAAAIVASLLCGVLLALLRLELTALARREFAGLPAAVATGMRGTAWLLNLGTRCCVELLRGLPVVIMIFFVGRGLPGHGFRFDDALWYVVIGLTIHHAVVIGEVLRSGVEGLPAGQREAAASIGLSSLQTTWLILLPQTFRIMLPALISQLVVIVKDTSLGFIVSYEELLDVARQVTQVLDNPIQLYLTIGAGYVAINYALSKVAQYLQRRLAR